VPPLKPIALQLAQTTFKEFRGGELLSQPVARQHGYVPCTLVDR